MTEQTSHNKFKSIELVNLNSEEFSLQIKNITGAILIDVRTKVEFDEGHIPNSNLIDIYLPTFASEILSLNRDKSYFLYCRSGSRSYSAGLFMIKNGFKKVYNLENGLLDWYNPLVTV